ncbi:MAG: SgcJ/EcaC family oxidoreductase [Planctomycetota bacterium]
MQTDEQAIRNLVAAWLDASAAGDVPKLQSLMAEDAVFLTPGQPPMRGRDAFITAFQAGLEHIRIEAKSEIQEIQIIGDFAWLSNHLTVTVTPRRGGPPLRRSGFTLTIFQKQPDGRWVLVRDANMLTTEAPSPT